MRPDTPTPEPRDTANVRFDQRQRNLAVLSVVGVSLALLLVAGPLLVSDPAAARFPINNFTNVDDTATVTPSGQNIAVSGWVKCTEGEIAAVRITARQDGVEATGKTHVRCLGEETVQFWTIHATSRGPNSFDTSSTVDVDAWAVTRTRGERTDGPHTWSNDDVTLIRR